MSIVDKIRELDIEGVLDEATDPNTRLDGAFALLVNTLDRIAEIVGEGDG